MNYKILGILLFLSYMVACSSQTSVSPEPTRPPSLQEQGNGKSLSAGSWEEQWGKAVAAGKKEGTVSLYASSVGPVLKEALPLLKNKFGINLEITTRTGSEIITSILTQRRAGIYLVDILVAGTNTFYGEVEPAGLAEPLDSTMILPEILDPNNWYGGEVNWVNPEHSGLHMLFFSNVNLAINTDLVKPGEIKAFRDLLDPKWKGKILINDPTIAGTSLKGFSVLGFGILGLDYFRQLAKQEPTIIRDQRLEITWLSQGKFPILLFPNTAFMVEFMKAGAPIDMLLAEEGTYLSRGGGVVSMVNKASHPNAAKVIVNWMFSKEGLTLISRGMGYQSARIDIPTEGLNPVQVRKPGVKYFLKSDTKEWTARDAEYKKAAQEVFGQYLR